VPFGFLFVRLFVIAERFAPLPIMMTDLVAMSSRNQCNIRVLMSTPSGEPPFPIEKSDFYHIYLLEQKAIADHKWFLSEKMGHDVGLDYAQYNWVMAGHRARWLAEVRAQSH
jgi:hypothetical protein